MQKTEINYLEVEETKEQYIYSDDHINKVLRLCELKTVKNDDLKCFINRTSELNLEGCKYITDEGLKFLTNLKSDLALVDCDKITNRGL
jgi:hypothetical protein